MFGFPFRFFDPRSPFCLYFFHSKINAIHPGEERMIKAIIFDLNGTLLDDVPYNIRAFQMVFRSFDLDIPDKRIEQAMGKPTSFIIEQILEENGIRSNPMELAHRKVDSNAIT